MNVCISSLFELIASHRCHDGVRLNRSSSEETGKHWILRYTRTFFKVMYASFHPAITCVELNNKTELN